MRLDLRIATGRSCLSRVSKLFLSLMQWLTYWLAWASVVFVIVTLIASTGLTGTEGAQSYVRRVLECLGGVVVRLVAVAQWDLRPTSLNQGSSSSTATRT